MRRLIFGALAFTCSAAAVPEDFAKSIRPVLAQNCAPCHASKTGKGPANFLKAESAQDVDNDRGMWRNVAAQLRNRTMPPVATKLTEDDRLRVANWVDVELRKTSCSAGDYAGVAAIRRLNRREYHNTVRDLLGVDFDAVALFPADGTGGAGFDTNGETLYTPPILTERYLEAAQQILDRVIVTPPLSRIFTPESHDIPTGDGYSFTVAVYADGNYNVQVFLDKQYYLSKLNLKVDGVSAGQLRINKPSAANNAGFPVVGRNQVRLTRGAHTFTMTNGEPAAVPIYNVGIDQKPEPYAPEKRALHYRLLGIEPGEEPLQPRKAARQVLAAFLPHAFRRPVETSEIERFMTLYDRAADRGDPYEEAIKLALKGVLVFPDFIFRNEQRSPTPGIRPLGQYEIATRLSYFLWSTAPDEQLNRLAGENRLQDPAVLTAQVDRMLDDSRSRAFSDTFAGQWLGTQDLGGRVVPLLTELQTYYTPEVAADLRAEPILLLDHIIGENRSLLELLSADYTFLTERLAKFYQLDDKVDVKGTQFRLVKWPDDRRGGVIEMGSVLAMNSHYKETSPVLRGAWALETILGTPVPPPPADVPPLDADKKLKNLSVRQKLEQHRADPNCAACHKLMDPIGFALENFDWMGRWRDKESNGQPLDTAGVLPSGDKFKGSVELRQVLLNHKDDFLRHISGKVLGYALGRSLQDGDSCTIQHLVDDLAKNNYQARTLIRDVVLSVPFRNTQGGLRIETPVSAAPKRQKPMITK
jgi:mono/diheme cytochrome c family protein